MIAIIFILVKSVTVIVMIDSDSHDSHDSHDSDSDSHITQSHIHVVILM